MPTICSYINPFSKEFHALDDFKRLTCPQKVGIVVVTTVLACSIIFSILAVPVFRTLVGRCSSQLSLTPADETQKHLFQFICHVKNLSDNVVHDFMDQKITRVKHLIVCKKAQEQKAFEIDMTTKNGSITRAVYTKKMQEAIEKIRQWALQQFKLHGLKEEIKISGAAFCLAQDTILGGDWATHHEAENFFPNLCTGTYVPIKDNFKEFLQKRVAELGLSLNAQITTPADFFNCKIVESSLAQKRAAELLKPTLLGMSNDVGEFFKQGEAAQVNHFCICKIGSKTEAFDIDLGRKVQSHEVIQTTEEAMEPVRNWVAMHSRQGMVQECEITCLSVYFSGNGVHAAVHRVMDGSSEHGLKTKEVSDKYKNVEKENMAQILQICADKYQLATINAGVWQTFSNRLAIEH